MDEIYIHKHKNTLIADLKNMISDLEDEHYSSWSFFDLIERKLKSWKDQMKMDEDSVKWKAEIQSRLDTEDKILLQKAKEAEEQPLTKEQLKWRKLWDKFKANIVPYQCFNCGNSDYLPTKEYLDLEHPDPEIYPICDFECGVNGRPLDQLNWKYRLGICECKLWKKDEYNRDK